VVAAPGVRHLEQFVEFVPIHEASGCEERLVASESRD
jgi:hypothetical protein